MHVERLFQIVFLLMSGSCGTAKELAEHCSVSVRTIQRDLDALSLAGIPVFSSRGYGGGIGLLKEFTLDKTFMTEQEQADILHGLQALEGAGYPDGNAALHKLAALFRRKEDRWLRFFLMVRIRVRQGKIPPAEGSYLGEKSCPLHLFQLRKPGIRACRGTFVPAVP